MTTTHEKYMRRCFELAQKGLGKVAPNPMVGAVVVHNGEIIGEGYHQLYGEAHAEPNAINSVKDQELLKESTLYVNLEPCSHYGKTPPCSLLIIQKQIPQVVICNVDPFPEVSGRGIKMLQDAGIDVSWGILKKEGWELNKRFFTFHEKKRPYIFLKWAQSEDGFIDSDRTDNTIPPTVFSTTETQRLNHIMRAEESAILVGTNTVLMDNPQLTNRMSEGNNPTRIVIDRKGIISEEYRILNDAAQTLVFTDVDKQNSEHTQYCKINFKQDILPQIMNELYSQRLSSVIVEGGSKVLQSFIAANIWDEAKVEIAPIKLEKGVKAPNIDSTYLSESQNWNPNKILIYKNNR